jgi:hypothetical protein
MLGAMRPHEQKQVSLQLYVPLGCIQSEFAERLKEQGRS